MGGMLHLLYCFLRSGEVCAPSYNPSTHLSSYWSIYYTQLYAHMHLSPNNTSPELIPNPTLVNPNSTNQIKALKRMKRTLRIRYYSAKAALLNYIN